jgi:hypothetical protein
MATVRLHALCRFQNDSSTAAVVSVRLRVDVPGTPERSHIKFSENILETNWRRERRFARGKTEMTERLRKLETEIARYRLHVIISELEAELQQAGEPNKRSRQGKA